MISLKGHVSKEIYAKGSKSEHLAVMIKSGIHKYCLRKEGGNPFMDPDIVALDRHYVEVSGRIIDDIFFVQSWKILG